jgi:hypothetical protein
VETFHSHSCSSLCSALRLQPLDLPIRSSCYEGHRGEAMRVSAESIRGRGDEGEWGEALRVERGPSGRVYKGREGDPTGAGKGSLRGLAG